MEVFGQDPGVYLEQEGIRPASVLDPTRRASLDPKLRAYVNYEIFFFADEDEKARFARDPRQWCGLLTDPVSRRRFHPTVDARRTEHAGRAYFFESDSTFAAFTATPDSFAVRRGM